MNSMYINKNEDIEKYTQIIDELGRLTIEILACDEFSRVDFGSGSAECGMRNSPELPHSSEIRRAS